MAKQPKLTMERTEHDLLLKADGQVIAQRGKPGTRMAGKLICEPGWEVEQSADLETIAIRYNGEPMMH